MAVEIVANKVANFAAVCLALFAIQLGFGAYGVLYTKLAKGSKVEPLIFCLYRDAACAPILFLASYVAEKKFMIPKSRDLLLFIAMGFIGMFLNQFAYILGVINTTPDTASLFQPLVPVVCSIIAILFRTERIPNLKTRTGFAKIFGILLATGGALLMTYGKNNVKKNSETNKIVGEPTAFGYVALVVNISSSSLYIVIQKKYIFNKPQSIWRPFPIGVTAWTYFSGSLWMGLASFYYVHQPQKFHIEEINVIYALFYAVFITSALCYMLITWTNMQVNSSFVTASWPMQSLFCVIISYIVLGETLVALEAVGGLMTILALVAVVWSNYKEEVSKYDAASIINVHSNSDDKKRLLEE